MLAACNAERREAAHATRFPVHDVSTESEQVDIQDGSRAGTGQETTRLLATVALSARTTQALSRNRE